MVTNTHLFREINEQPAALRRLIDSQQGAIAQLAKAIREREITHVTIAARGTSDNAGRYAKYVLGAMNGLPVALATPSLFSVYERPPTFGNALVLGISQSGKSPDIVSVLAEARRQNVLAAALTNEPDSDLAEQADFVIALEAGEEKAVAATKTYTTELMAIALLSASLAEDAARLEAVKQVPVLAQAMLAMTDRIAADAPRYRYMSRCVVIGRGYNYATAFELALKLKELTYITVEPYSSADFMHGPLALIEPGFPVILLAPSGAMVAEMATFAETLRKAGAEVICISDEESLLKAARIAWPLPQSLPEWLSPITSIIPGQLFALHLAHACDYNIDQPRAIHKVTETV